MTDRINLEDLDFAALMCSRICHDIISPVGAITNGLEVLDEENNEEMRSFAFDLIRKSAKTASAKLQYARLAFGAAGSAGAEVDLGDAELVATRLMESEKPALVWKATRILLPKNQVKLLLNLLLIAIQAVPRGGTLTVEVEGGLPCPLQRITAAGPAARIPQRAVEILAGIEGEGHIDAHQIQPYYAARLAASAGMAIEVRKEGEDVVVEASLIQTSDAAL